MNDFDSPWKEALDEFLKEFLELFFPNISALIDWSVPVQSLQAELVQILRGAELGSKTVDRLYLVTLLDGTVRELYIHLEVQCQYDNDLSRRLYVYQYRIYDLAARLPVSIVVFGDDHPDWRPSFYHEELLGCELKFGYNTVKLLDYRDRIEELEKSPNPFAPFVLAHLQTLATNGDPEQRREWKFRLLRGLYDRGLHREQIVALIRVIDWIMDLPPEQMGRLKVDMEEFERSNSVPYVTSFERAGIEQGRAEGQLIGTIRTLERVLGNTPTPEEVLSHLTLDQLQNRLAVVENDFQKRNPKP